MHFHNLPAELRARAGAHVEHLWASTNGFDEAGIIADLPEALQLEVSNLRMLKHISYCQLFSFADNAVQKSLALVLKTQQYSPEDTILYATEVARELFFLVSGAAEVRSPGEIIFL